MYEPTKIVTNYGDIVSRDPMNDLSSFDIKRVVGTKTHHDPGKIIQDIVLDSKFQPNGYQSAIESSSGLGLSSAFDSNDPYAALSEVAERQKLLQREDERLKAFKGMQSDRYNAINEYNMLGQEYDSMLDGTYKIPDGTNSDTTGTPGGAYTIPNSSSKSPSSNSGVYVRTQVIGGKRYNPFTKTYGTQATRNFNPTNITGASGLLYGAKKIALTTAKDQGDKKQLVFGSPEDGWRAARALASKKMYNNAPIKDAFAKWQSDQKAWGRIKNTMVKNGIDINKRFVDLPLSQQLKFLQIRANHEGYHGPKVTASMFA